MKSIFLIILFFFQINIAQAEIPHYLDFKKVLNKTIAGKNAQETLSKNFKSESEKYKKIEAGIKKEEIQLISKKKIIKEEEYKKEIEQLRKKVVKLQNDKQKSINAIATSRRNAKKNILAKLNPILQKYMEEKKIRLVLDKNSVLIGKSELEITNNIIELFNKEVKSIDFKW